MEFSFSEEQIQLRETVHRFLQQHSTTQEVRQLMESETGYDSQTWRRLHDELGIGGVNIPEEFGGAGLGFVEQCIVLEEMGYALFCSPYFSSNVLASQVLRLFATNEQAATELPPLITGTNIVTVALYEPCGSFNTEDVATSYVDGVVSGSKTLVTDALLADAFLILARDIEGTLANRFAFYVVDASSEGIRKLALDSIDPTRKIGKIEFERVAATRIGTDTKTTDVARFNHIATTAIANEMIGGAQRLLDSAVSYANTRVQFGRAIGSLQAIKHKCADLLLEVELAKSAAYRSAAAVDENDPDLPALASIAKAAASDAYMKAAADCIQIHGGIGFTWENDTHLWFKRAKSSEVFLGSATHHRELLMQHWNV